MEKKKRKKNSTSNKKWSKKRYMAGSILSLYGARERHSVAFHDSLALFQLYGMSVGCMVAPWQRVSRMLTSRVNSCYHTICVTQASSFESHRYAIRVVSSPDPMW